MHSVPLWCPLLVPLVQMEVAPPVCGVEPPVADADVLRRAAVGVTHEAGGGEEALALKALDATGGGGRARLGLEGNRMELFICQSYGVLI